MSTGRIQARVDGKLLKKAEKLLKAQGVKLSQAITMFLTAVKNNKGCAFLFDNACPYSHEPNEELAKELRLALTGEGVTEYETAEEMFKHLKSLRQEDNNEDE